MDELKRLIAAETARGPFEVHSFAILTTHCHLLVRCPPRRLPASLRRIFAPYARSLNRRLKRDGPLFGSRSRAHPVETSAHWEAVVGYIDRNPVEAGLARTPAGFPFGSAWHYARPAGPAWLRRDIVEGMVCRRVGATHYDPADYARVFHRARVRSMAPIVARRAESSPVELDPLDDLLSAAPIAMRRWLEARARHADGGAAGPVLVTPEALLQALARERGTVGSWTLDPGGRCRPGPRVDVWRVLAAGLLRASAGLALAEIATRLELSISGVHLHVSRHRRLIASDSTYAERAQRVASAALGSLFGRVRTDDH